MARFLGIPSTLDCSTMQSRTENEGERFLTLDMPRLGVFFEDSLAEGHLVSPLPEGFTSRSKTDKRPRFLHGFFALMFSDDGTLLEDVPIFAVRALRQVLYLHSKLKELPTPDKVELALQQFIRTDSEIDNAPPLELVSEFRRVARRLWGPMFSRIESRSFELDSISCKHGPGAVAQKLLNNQKWASREWTESLDSVFPWFLFLSHIGSSDREGVVLHRPGTEPPSRVIPVPKTAKGPRLIAAEPVYNQFVQQGLSTLFAEEMNSHPCVSIDDQSANQRMARKGSFDGSHSTLDLSEASDRVSLSIVKFLLRDHPGLLTRVLVSRTKTSELPDGTTVVLKKFASMGSALTFPIETLVFATIARMAVERVQGVSAPVSEETVRVYGDDIIVPTDCTNETVTILEAFGFKVNAHKSFTKGNFRESCGGDYFMGVPVNPTRTRQRLPQSRRDVSQIVAIVAFRNLYVSTYGETEMTASLDSYINGIIPFPYGPRDTAYLVKDNKFVPKGRTRDTQQAFVYAYRPVYTYRDDSLNDYAAIRKCLSSPFQEDKKHLQRSGRPTSARLKRGMATSF